MGGRGRRTMNDWKKVLIAVDDTPTSDKGLAYAGNIIGKLEGVQVCLLHIYPEPPPDYYSKGDSLTDYKRQREEQAAEVLDRSTNTLAGFGIGQEAISRDVRMAEQTTISEAILDAQRQGEFGTVVVGKRGVSKAEEFLFG
ncbi:MAG TPA: universal stress protein, partial [Desulfobulbaceae bacterium]|nr:universal stress protein [Desulfobulbaceae bacterium]